MIHYFIYYIYIFILFNNLIILTIIKNRRKQKRQSKAKGHIPRTFLLTGESSDVHSKLNKTHKSTKHTSTKHKLNTKTEDRLRHRF